jgi:thymidylate synthase (FAD)
LQGSWQRRACSALPRAFYSEELPSTAHRDDTMDTKRPTVPAAEEILGGYFPVLDHGFVALVDYMGTDDSIERAARVSYGYGTRQSSQTRGLIRYLRRHRHTTPSEMVELQFHCAMPMFVARQWIRHRTANVNEYSGRYSLIPLLFYTPQAQEFALQSPVNNQGRQDAAAGADLYDAAVDRWENLRAGAAATYGWLVAADVARELARIDLPLSTYTQWYWKIDLHNLLHFLSLRADAHAQYEIRAFAEVMAGIVKRVAPLSYEAWIDYQVAGSVLSRGELQALQALLESDEENIRVRAGAGRLSVADLKQFDLSAREARELLEKLRPRPVPDYELDLARMRSAADIEREMRAAVPVTDRAIAE